MSVPRNGKSCESRGCKCKRNWRDGILSVVMQIITFCGLCYLLIVFHYELVRSKSNEKALAAQLSQLKGMYRRIEHLPKRTSIGQKSQINEKRGKPLQSRDKRGTADSKSLGAVIHMVALPSQRISPDGYVRFKHDCDEICVRGDSHFRISKDADSDYITVVDTGVYFIYAQVEYRGDFEMSHSIEIGTNNDGGVKTFFQGGGTYKDGMNNLISGVAFIHREWKIRVKVSFKGDNVQTFSFTEEKTYFGMFRVNTGSTGS